MKIKINNKECELKYSYRALMLFEDKTGKSLANANDSLGTLLQLLYCFVQVKSDVTEEEFYDWIDEDPKNLPNLSVWLGKEMNKWSAAVNKSPLLKKANEVKEDSKNA